MSGENLEDQRQTIQDLINEIQTTRMVEETARECGETSEQLADRFMNWLDDNDHECDTLAGMLHAWREFMSFLDDEDSDDWDEDDGHPSETTEWGDFDPLC